MLKRLAMIFGATFVLVGLLGFVPNPLVGPDAFFRTNTPHNVLHLLIGVVLVVASTQGERASWLSMLVFGAAYLMLAVMGYAAIGNVGHADLLGFVHVNGNDNWLHVLLGVVLIAAAMGARGTKRVPAH